MPNRHLPQRFAALGLVALLLGLAAACQPTTSLLPATTKTQASQTTHLTGRVEFPEWAVQQTAGGVVNQATVTLYNASNQAIAVGRTDALGTFSLDPGTGFAPAAGDTFVLDAYKSATASGVGSDVLRLRTIVAWGGSGWNSVSGATLLINAATTAVCVIQGLNAGTMHPRDTLNAVSGTSVTGSAFVDQGPTVSMLVTDLLSKDQDPVARISYADGRYFARPDQAALSWLERFQDGTFTDTSLDASGLLQLGGPKPQPRDASSELSYFQCAGMNNDGAGVVATDGTYLYVRAWSSYANSTANAWVFKKIGTGYGGTTPGTNYGTVGPVTNGSSTAVYWNGGLYMRTSNPNELLRVDIGTNATSLITTSATTFERTMGKPGVPDLLACDGTYFYNLSYGIDARTSGEYNGFTVQVLNPANGFSLVRQFTMDTSSYYTDGVFCDGTYIYPIEWLENGSSRLRRYRLSDGQLEAETRFTQTTGIRDYNAAANDPISGAWDPVNKVFWIGNLTNDWVHKLRGGNYHPSGSYTSAPIDSQSGAAQYGRLNWTATMPAGTSLSFKVRSGNTLADLSAATWYGPTGTSDSYTASGTRLNPVHAKQRYLQVQATLGTTDTLVSPKLSNLSVEVLP